MDIVTENDAKEATPEKSTTPANSRVYNEGNPFGLSDNVFGCILIIVSALVGSVETTMYNATLDQGISSNALTFAAVVVGLLLTLLVDGYYYHYGYAKNGAHWFVFGDIWNNKQRSKAFGVKYFWQWFVFGSIINYIDYVLALFSLFLVSDAGDAVAIYDSYPIFIPCFGLCIKNSGDDWKHRYFICLLLIIISVVLISEPGFIFGYSNDSDINETDQIIGCLIALISAICTAFTIVATVMQKKVAYLDLISSSNNIDING